MTGLNKFWFSVFLLIGLPLLSGCLELHVSVAFKPDGTIRIIHKETHNRKEMKEYVKKWEGYIEKYKGLQPLEETTGTPGRGEKITEKLPLDPETEKLRKRILRMYGARLEEQTQTGKKTRLENVEMGTNKVDIVITTDYESLESFIGQDHFYIPGNYSRIQAEKTPEGRLKIEVSRDDGSWGPYYVQSWLQNLGLHGFKGSLDFEMPGDIISSTLPADGKSISLSLDAAEKASREAFLEFLSLDKQEIIFDAGGIILEYPLDSEVLRREKATDDKAPINTLALVESGPGYMADAMSIVTSQVITFGDEEKEQKREPYGISPSAKQYLKINGRLYAPPKRFFLGVEKIKVLKATDNKGRDIPIKTQEGQWAFMLDMKQEPADQADFSLSIGLPESDAEFVKEVLCEAVVLTFSGWRELALENLEKKRAKYDLSNLIQNSFIEIVKLSKARRKGAIISFKASGAKEVRYLHFDFTDPEIYLSSVKDETREKNGITVREAELEIYYINDYDFSWKGTAMIIKYPKELKRESVKFKMEELDLL